MATSGSDGSEGSGAAQEKEDERPKIIGPTTKGQCKWFNVAKGFGFITPADGTGDVFVHQTKIDMLGFRSLDENEEVEFQFETNEKGREATVVTGPEGARCKGSKRRPKPKFRRKSNKCYNCGKQGHHAKDCDLPEQPKLCHRCQSDAHLIADCPEPAPEPAQGAKGGKKNGNNDSSDSAEVDTPELPEAESEEGAKGENGHT